MTAMHRSDFETVFAGPGAYVDADGHRIEVRVELLAPIALDGVAIGDPLTGSMVEVRPPRGSVQKVDAVVELAVARFPNADERVAAARVLLAERPVTSWIEADHGMEVDAGTAAIGPVAALPKLDSEEGGDQVMRALDATYRETWSAARVVLDGQALCAFSSGFGDGVYAAWWGVDAHGDAAALALDFDVLIVPVFDELRVPRPAGRGRVHAPEIAARGVGLSVPWLSAHWIEVSMGALPKDRFVAFRFRRPGEVVYSVPRHHPAGAMGRDFKIDLREIPADAEMFLRVVSGHRPMSPAALERPPFR